MREHPEPRPRDDRDVAQHMARDLADIAGQLASLKGEANSWLRDPNYDALKLRLEIAHSVVEAAAVEARRKVRLNDGRYSRSWTLASGRPHSQGLRELVDGRWPCVLRAQNG